MKKGLLNIAAVYLIALFSLSVCRVSAENPRSKQLLIQPFKNKVFVTEHGQFKQCAQERKISFPESVFYGVENAEFDAYFNATGISFLFAERKHIESVKREKETEERIEEEKDIETTWHSLNLQWLNTDSSVKLTAEQKVTEYYNYGGFADENLTFNFVPAYKKIKYTNLYPGVDAEFELPETGGIKYKLYVHPNTMIPAMAFQWEGTDKVFTDEKGDLHINNIAGQLLDHAPIAFTADSHTNIPVKYFVDGNKVQFQFSSQNISSPEGIVIDPWITNPNFSGLNRAYDIQEDSTGNVFVHGNFSQSSSGNTYHVQKYSPAGALIWDYATYSVFLGDIAVDNPGNVYIIGGYCTGKRQKLDPNGTQLWVQSGLCEEWRLAFNYSKTVLAIGGYFINPLGNNLAKLDMNTGAISNQIVYGEETRAIATDCNGDIYSLHVTFGYSGSPSSNILRKTDANFNPAGSTLSGFLLCEAEPAGIGYATNPDYSSVIYQGINGIAVYGNYVYVYDGATLNKFDKNSLTMVGSVSVPNGTFMLCSGVAADLCSNIYVGTMSGIAKFDTTLSYQATISTPGAVYDITLGKSSDLLACGNGFLGSFSTNCSPQQQLTATVTITACDLGSVTLNVTGGIAPYFYNWQPGGQTTATVLNLSAGTYSYSVNDAFCHTYQGTVIINPKPVATFSANNICAGTPISFTDQSTISSGTITQWNWNFGDSNTSTLQNPSHFYSTSGNYIVMLTVTSDLGCSDSITNVIYVYTAPVSNFSATTVCQGNSTAFTDLTNGATSWIWDFRDGNTSILQNPSNTYSTSGTYNVSLITTSSNGCTDSTMIPVTVNPIPVINIISDTSICSGGSIQLTASGGITYAWSPGGSLNDSTIFNPVTSPLNATFYTVTITDANGCANQASVTVSVSAALSVNVTSLTNVTCYGLSNGSATVTSTGSSPFTYSWSLSGGTNASATGLNTGTYIVTVTDSRGCMQIQSVTITEPPQLVLNFKRDYYTCEEGSGGIQLNVSGGTSYSWLPTIGLSNPTIANPLATVVVNTTYTVTVYDGLCSDTAHVNIFLVPAPSPPNIFLSGDTLHVPQAYAAYQWYFNGYPAIGATDSIYIVTQNGTYAVMIYDSIGCHSLSNGILITEVNDLIDKPAIIIYPNPARSSFIIRLNVEIEYAEVFIFDLIGKEIMRKKFTRNTIELERGNLASGFYFVRVITPEKQYIQKIVVK